MLLPFFQNRSPQWVFEAEKLLRYSSSLFIFLCIIIICSYLWQTLFNGINCILSHISCYWVTSCPSKSALPFVFILWAPGLPRVTSLGQVLKPRHWIRMGWNMFGNRFCRWLLFNKGLWYVKDRRLYGDWKSCSCRWPWAPAYCYIYQLYCGKLSSSLVFFHLSKCLCAPRGSHFGYIGSYFSISYR